MGHHVPPLNVRRRAPVTLSVAAAGALAALLALAPAWSIRESAHAAVGETRTTTTTTRTTDDWSTDPQPSEPTVTVDPDNGRPGTGVHVQATDLPRCSGSWRIDPGVLTITSTSPGRDQLTADGVVDKDADTGPHQIVLRCAAPTHVVAREFTVSEPDPPTTTTTTATTTKPTATTMRSTTPTSSTNQSSVSDAAVSTTPPFPTTTDQPPREGSSPFAAVAVIGLVSAVTAGGVAVGARARRPGRWVAEHVVTRPDPGPSTVAVQPPDGDRDDHSIRFDLRGDAGSQAIEEDRDDPDRDDPD